MSLGMLPICSPSIVLGDQMVEDIFHSQRRKSIRFMERACTIKRNWAPGQTKRGVSTHIRSREIDTKLSGNASELSAEGFLQKRKKTSNKRRGGLRGKEVPTSGKA